MTDEAHTSARILEIKPLRVKEELQKNSIVVLAGFQGVSPKSKEITTLGRGGSDTTAVAVAAAFGAKYCEILKDVDGVYTTDPHKFSQAKHLPNLHYSHLLDMTFWGAKVLHYRSVELAALLNVEIEIKLAHSVGLSPSCDSLSRDKSEQQRSTKITGETSMFEQGRIIAINFKNDVRKLRIKTHNIGAAYESLSECLEKSQLPWPQLLHSHTTHATHETNHNTAHNTVHKTGDKTADKTGSEQVCELIYTSSSEAVTALNDIFSNYDDFVVDQNEYCTISLTCQGLIASDLSYKYLTIAKQNNITVYEVFFWAMGMSILIKSDDQAKCLEIMQNELASQL